MNIKLNSDIEIFGTKTENSKLYLVTFICQEDPEDTTSEFWVADDTDILEDQLKYQWSGCDSDEEFQEWDDMYGYEFDDVMYSSILVNEIGTV